MRSRAQPWFRLTIKETLGPSSVEQVAALRDEEYWTVSRFIEHAWRLDSHADPAADLQRAFEMLKRGG